MLQPGEKAPTIDRLGLEGGRPSVVVFFEADCPTCHLALPYLNRLHQRLGAAAKVLGVSQDSREQTGWLVEKLPVAFPVVLDEELAVTRAYDPQAVPSIFLIDAEGVIQRSIVAFSKRDLNTLADELCTWTGTAPFALAPRFDGAPDERAGCVSRHLEEMSRGESAAPLELYTLQGRRAGRVEIPGDADPYEYCFEAGFADALPVVPPTSERVERMMAAVSLPPGHVVVRIPPNYGEATVEKIAANAVMAGCRPEMMPVLMRLLQAACDERFNLHGVQATTHFAAPLVIVNGPVRGELGFASGSNVFSNVARANSTLGRAFQLILTNLGGARPGEIDMSALGNPGKFSFVIAENEEASPWAPLSETRGIEPGLSALTLFAAEPPRGVSEHVARDARGVLSTIRRALATVWSYGACGAHEAVVVLCPEHTATIARDGFSKRDVVEFLYERTVIPARDVEADGGEGLRMSAGYQTVMVGGEPCYRKFASPESLSVVVAGGPAGKFSAVIGSWSTGPRGSQMVTYPID